KRRARKPSTPSPKPSFVFLRRTLTSSTRHLIPRPPVAPTRSKRHGIRVWLACRVFAPSGGSDHDPLPPAARRPSPRGVEHGPRRGAAPTGGRRGDCFAQGLSVDSHYRFARVFSIS